MTPLIPLDWRAFFASSFAAGIVGAMIGLALLNGLAALLAAFVNRK